MKISFVRLVEGRRLFFVIFLAQDHKKTKNLFCVSKSPVKMHIKCTRQKWSKSNFLSPGRPWAAPLDPLLAAPGLRLGRLGRVFGLILAAAWPCLATCAHCC